VLYKRADHENPKWTARLKIPEVPGFVVKSTKTTLRTIKDADVSTKVAIGAFDDSTHFFQTQLGIASRRHRRQIAS
jgi:hypothetical protein